MVKNKHTSIKHIWFDLAGTLYKESLELKTALQMHGYIVYGKLTGKSDKEQIKQEFDDLYKKYGSKSAAFRSLGQADDYWQKEAAAFERKTFFRPDQEVITTLTKLRKMLPISLYTNFKQQQIEELLGYLMIPQQLFTHILSGDDVASRKPALDGFYLMIERSGLPAEELLYVGDREAVDIVPAKKVGMQACMLYGQSEVADYTFQSFSDLLSVVK